MYSHKVRIAAEARARGSTGLSELEKDRVFTKTSSSNSHSDLAHNSRRLLSQKKSESHCSLHNEQYDPEKTHPGQPKAFLENGRRKSLEAKAKAESSFTYPQSEEVRQASSHPRIDEYGHPQPNISSLKPLGESCQIQNEGYNQRLEKKALPQQAYSKRPSKLRASKLVHDGLGSSKLFEELQLTLNSQSLHRSSVVSAQSTRRSQVFPQFVNDYNYMTVLKGEIWAKALRGRIKEDEILPFC